MKNKIVIFGLIILIIIAAVYLYFLYSKPTAKAPDFMDDFSVAYTVKEAGSTSKGDNPNWWLSSGGYFFSANGIGGTIMGPLAAPDPWRIAYAASNPIDTDDGFYPQNIFRLVLKSKWQNFQQEMYFKIVKDNLSASPNRNSSNGLLFFNRYQDAFNLYYTGLRVDGYVTIKKKIGGIYYTLAYEPFTTGATSTVYNRDSNPNLLPQNIWIGLRSEVKTNPDNTVSIKLYVDENKNGHWVLAAEAVDDGKSFGGTVFAESGHAGLRTDFMDVQFNDYQISNLAVDNSVF